MANLMDMLPAGIALSDTSHPSYPAGLDATRWLYDNPTGLLTNKLYADGLGPAYAYTPEGKLATRSWARGVTTAYTYDATGSLAGVDYSDDTPDIAYTYDRSGNMTSVIDASGTRIFVRVPDGRILSDSIQFQNEAFKLHEAYDTFGRSSGYALSNSVDGTSSLIAGIDQGHDDFGRISEVSVSGVSAPFRYGWLPGSDLVQSLAMPNGVTRQTTYDPLRDMLASITHTNAAGTILTQRAFSYDAAGHLTARTQYRLGDTTNRLDTFDYNLRSELTQAYIDINDYAYAYDPIGNRQTAHEPDFSATYTANSLNQYSGVSCGQPPAFTPIFDPDGNQTLLKTTTGIWHVRYNGENRPVCFSNETAVIEMDYDCMGRRFEYRETVGDTTTRHERHLYRDYLRIAALDMLADNAVIHTVVWDPTEPVATRPLLLSTPSGWHTYGFDQVKNVTEVFDASGDLAAAYDYAPFGAVIQSSGSAVQLNPITFSSEIDDSALGLVYYNWRHLNVFDGRWTNRDPINEEAFSCFYFDTIKGRIRSLLTELEKETQLLYTSFLKAGIVIEAESLMAEYRFYYRYVELLFKQGIVDYNFVNNMVAFRQDRLGLQSADDYLDCVDRCQKVTEKCFPGNYEALKKCLLKCATDSFYIPNPLDLATTPPITKPGWDFNKPKSNWGIILDAIKNVANAFKNRKGS